MARRPLREASMKIIRQPQLASGADASRKRAGYETSSLREGNAVI
jgi:hypothetical protein